MTKKSLHTQALDQANIIPHLERDWDQVPWREQINDNVTTCGELLEIAGLKGKIDVIDSPTFSVKVPRRWAERISKGDEQDPILLQVLARSDESIVNLRYTKDPLDEAQFIPTNGVLHKYSHRVLLLLSGACAVNCRYCFRRSFPYATNTVSGEGLSEAMHYIRTHDSIFEVILSGGDPLMTSNERLGRIIAEIDKIPHVTNLRIHSRIPVMIPQRIDEELLTILQTSSLTTTLVLHCNHHQEIPHMLGHYIRKLMSIGVHTLNQSVLLRGVNDSVQSLSVLSRELNRHRVLPYYLHLLDPVEGASHFELTSKPDVKELYQSLMNSLPGFLVPKLVREVPGQASKSLICTHCSHE